MMNEPDPLSSQFRPQRQEPSIPVEDMEVQGGTLIEAITQLVLRKWLIAAVTGISFLLGIVLCFAVPARYTAVTRIMPPKQTPSTTSFLNAQVGMGSLADAAGGTLLRDPNAIYIGLLKSRPIADVIINRFDLLKAYNAVDMTSARKTLANSTKILSEPSTLISISVSGRDKSLAADIANAYAEQLSTLTKTISVTEASKRRRFFEEQLKAEKETLIAAEVAFQQVQQNKGLVHLDAQANVLINGLAGLRGQIAAKEVELQALQSYSTEHNPEVQLAERELSTLQAEASQMGEHSQSGEFSNMGLKDVPKAGLDYVRADRELRYQQSLFDLLLRQYEAARLDEAKEAAVIQVVEPAIRPDKKSSPIPTVIIPLAGFFGLFFGCIYSLFLNWIAREEADPGGAAALRRLKIALIGKAA